MIDPARFRRRVLSPSPSLQSANPHPPRWPPPPDFPIVTDDCDRVISRYADAIWISRPGLESQSASTLEMAQNQRAN